MLNKFKRLMKHEDFNPWLFVLIFTTVLAAPSGVLNKLILGEAKPYAILTARYVLVALILLPTLIKGIKKYKSILAKKIKYILPLTITCALGAPAYMTAMSLSNASFIAVLDLLTPILFVIVSTIVMKDKLTRNAFVGIMFAVLGGSIILIFPMLFNWSESSITGFGWLPVALMAYWMLQDAIYPVALRKFNSEGLPLAFVLSIFFTMTAVVSAVFALAFHGTESLVALGGLPTWGWAIIIFQAIGLSIVFRWLNIKAYENLGTATTASINYLYYALAIGLPLMLLGEELPIEVAFGAVFIIIGIILVRRHPHLHAHHAHGHIK